MTRRLFLFWTVFAVLGVLTMPRMAYAQACSDETPLQCSSAIDGARCPDGRVCIAESVHAGVVEGSCQYACATNGDCSLGEACVEAQGIGGLRSYCKPVPFRVDLNLLDQCIAYFLDGKIFETSSPSTNSCSLNARLGQMLNRNGDRAFNIDDVDLCIKDFLETPACDPAMGTCPGDDSRTACASDDECGAGSYCDPVLKSCTRDCGFIVSRGHEDSLLSGGAPAAPTKLERPCFARMTACNYARGRCEPAAADVTCHVDRDCPAGGFCNLGTCTPKCYRNADCPGSDWYCAVDNTCQPKPRATPPGGEVFLPQNYSVVFAERSASLTQRDDHAELPIAIMDVRTQTQVFKSPQVVFGYRLELKYARKLDPKCSDFARASPADQEDCLISPDEEFLILENPFGTVYADGDPTVSVRLNPVAAQKLTAGRYEATLTAIFNNGQSDTIRVGFVKPTANGEYQGRVSVYDGRPENVLGTSALGMRLHIDKALQKTWDSLLDENHVLAENEFQDLTSGYVVRGVIHGQGSQIFEQPFPLAARGADPAGNEIPFKGIYSPASKRMRIVAVVDLPASFCTSLDGVCGPGSSGLIAKNPFGRAVRRYIQLIGPFDEGSGTFEGVYRETITGLVPYPYTLSGGFRAYQQSQIDTPIELPAPLLATAAPAKITFPSASAAITQLDATIRASCAPADAARATTDGAFPALFDEYVATRTSLDKLVSFDAYVEKALALLGGGTAQALTIYDVFRDQMKPCSSTVTESCIDAKKLRCDVAILEKGLLKGLVRTDTIQGDDNALFCPKNGGGGGCGTLAAQNFALAAYQQHNRVYETLTDSLMVGARADVSDAFYTLLRAEDGTRFGIGGAVEYKKQRLLSALGQYDQILEHLVSPAGASMLFAWPMQRFVGRGDVWLAQADAMLRSRTDALSEVVDIERRLQSLPPGRDRAVVEQALHVDYLSRAYFMALEHEWEKERFVYSQVDLANLDNPLAAGDQLLARLDETRNPLGIRPERVFLERNPEEIGDEESWKFYLHQLDRSLQRLRSYAGDAVREMRGALASSDKLAETLGGAAGDLEAQLLDLCGEDVGLPAGCTEEAKQRLSVCRGQDCAVALACTTDDCRSVASMIKGGANDVACRADTQVNEIQYMPGPPGPNVAPVRRRCVRGKVGGVLQERSMVNLQREQTFARLQRLVREFERESEYVRFAQGNNQDLVAYLERNKTQVLAMKTGLAVANEVYELARNTATNSKCMVIVGLANGTDCPQSIASGIAAGIAITTKFAAAKPLELGLEASAMAKEIELTQAGQRKEERELLDKLETKKSEIETVLREHQVLTQQLFNLDIQLQDLTAQATAVAARFSDRVNDVTKRLRGREEGTFAARDGFVAKANAEFRRAQLEAYKALQAFLYRFNWKMRRATLESKLFAAVTAQDLSDFKDGLENDALAYPGTMGQDPGTGSQRRVYAFSLRQNLFPELRDIVSPDGKLLTAGEQFHQTITSSRFRRKSASGGEEIAIPFAIWATKSSKVAAQNGNEWLLPRGECNHLISARTTQGPIKGTMLVVVQGVTTKQTPANAEGGFEYIIRRGDTDYLRSCTDGPDTDPAVNTYMIAPSPENAREMAPFPKPYVWQSLRLPAFRYSPRFESVSQVPDDYWSRYFEGRSLSAADYEFVIPDVTTAQSWILDPASTDKIEDVTFYFRYRADTRRTE